MKTILEFIKKVIFFLFELNDRMQKSSFISKAESTLLDLEYKKVLDNSKKMDEDIRDAKRLINAMKNCPAVILVDEMNRLLSFDKKDITEQMCENLVSRLELYSK